MPTLTHTSNDTLWTSAKYNHKVAQRAWAAVEPEDDCIARQQAAADLDDARRILFSVPAPDITALIDKLTIWWGKLLSYDTDTSLIKCRVIGDLRRIQLKAVGSDEMEASGRSPEAAAADDEAWRSSMGYYLDQQRLFAEGPSARWEGREEADIVSAMLLAARELLNLPAPSLGGVIHKLELLWKDNRLEPVANGAMYVLLMRDLNRLSRPEDA
jgi:hypothetical protein